MPKQLNILAIEPYFGGARRLMLESIQRCSKHQWTLLKLPPRRIERRMTTSAVWFAEVLNRQGLGRCDVLFVSEALNLHDLLQLAPELRKIPAVIYFHENQLPADDAHPNQLGVVNLSSALGADEVWFNSLHHMRSFVLRASQLVANHPNLAGRNPVSEIAAKAQIVPPPVPTQDLIDKFEAANETRSLRNILVDTRAADIGLLNETVDMLRRRDEKFELHVVGPTGGLSSQKSIIAVDAFNADAVDRAMVASGIFLSTQVGAVFDYLAIRALASGCWGLVPQNSIYNEYLPSMLHAVCMHDGLAETIAARLQDIWYLERARGYEMALQNALRRFEPAVACRVIDHRLEQIAVSRYLVDGDELPTNQPHATS